MGCRHRFWLSMLGLLMWWVPLAAQAEIWTYACAETITLLRQAQVDVTERNTILRQAKLALTILPSELETCRTGRRERDGQLYCVRHRQPGPSPIRRVIQAEKALARAVLEFEEILRVIPNVCRSRPLR